MVERKFKLRMACCRLLGPEITAYMLHLRPLEWPIITVHFLFGSILASGLNLDFKLTMLGWLIFVVMLNGGTMAINSAFDKDEGNIGYLRNPPKPPKYLLHLSIVMLTISLLLGFTLPSLFMWCNTSCIIMSVIYSVPPLRLKAKAGWDLLINSLGFGLLTPLAGWGLTKKPLTISMFIIITGFMVLFGALYPLTQFYQITEDIDRGDRTFIVVIGKKQSLILSIVLTVIAHLCFAWGVMHYNYKLTLVPIVVSIIAWLIVIVPWLINCNLWNSKQHETSMYRALLAWFITNISLIIQIKIC